MDTLPSIRESNTSGSSDSDSDYPCLHQKPAGSRARPPCEPSPSLASLSTEAKDSAAPAAPEADSNVHRIEGVRTCNDLPTFDAEAEDPAAAAAQGQAEDAMIRRLRRRHRTPGASDTGAEDATIVFDWDDTLFS